MFLPVQFAGAAGHFTPGFRTGGAHSHVGTLADQRLMDDGLIHRYPKYTLIQIDSLEFRPLTIVYDYFHYSITFSQ